MSTRRLVIALVTALVLSGLVTFYLNHKIRARIAETGPIATRKVVAAARALEAGTVIKAEDVAVVEWPTRFALQGTFENSSDVIGRSVIYPIPAQQPVLDGFVTVPGTGFGLTAKIPEGMRAISVHSDEIVGVAGFLFPGSHVDVLVTLRPDNSSGDVATQTVLQDVGVLTAGQNTQPDPQAKPATAAVVTLLLKPEDAEKLVLASTQGTIHFVLRNGADHDVVAVVPVRTNDLSGTLRAAVPKSENVRVRKPATQPYEVETFMGEKRSSTKFE
ncbi:MAG: Flp pilus assembly protein CpaB [Candidatus Korobacteraceae bacterium]